MVKLKQLHCYRDIITEDEWQQILQFTTTAGGLALQAI